MENRVCSRGVWDSTMPGIEFDADGVSNYARMFERLVESYPRGEKGEAEWRRLVERMKAAGKGKKYDCVVGVSGGTEVLNGILYVENGAGLGSGRGCRHPLQCPREPHHHRE